MLRLSQRNLQGYRRRPLVYIVSCRHFNLKPGVHQRERMHRSDIIIIFDVIYTCIYIIYSSVFSTRWFFFVIFSKATCINCIYNLMYMCTYLEVIPLLCMFALQPSANPGSTPFLVLFPAARVHGPLISHKVCLPRAQPVLQGKVQNLEVQCCLNVKVKIKRFALTQHFLVLKYMDDII